MATSATPGSTPNRYPKVASPVHTVLVLAGLGVWTYLAMAAACQLRAAATPNRVRVYLLTIFLEWSLFLLVLLGVRRSGGSVLIVLGDNWHSVRQVLRDTGVAAGFLLISVAFLWMFSLLLRIPTQGHSLDFILPRGLSEIVLWIVLSVSAGICEEAIFRGYLQLQFTALTKSVPVGIFLSAVAFGAAHAYQGFRRATLISLYGAMFGILAYWRRSVRPGMIAHVCQDSLGGVLGSLMRH
jgi:membrane protease YdiL (CAAX protease family)